ncbi:protein CHROMATIN REMODELING 20 isoform X2 [Physcomitrium patens]|uniref:ATP-dependent helicase ATRX n=1 Tax=Physcomitrium patens TaxID=3218 RepID=A0A7I4F428_PHYPA|nr:protein CHROMATIN REMODELING 20-like isoform X2 [Physcomitrium patens]|eukprot:XP_024393599.1 protein CHROMATIN REMODELING 20-like isoform X2 [Physcomitrella patens]
MEVSDTLVVATEDAPSHLAFESSVPAGASASDSAEQEVASAIPSTSAAADIKKVTWEVATVASEMEDGGVGKDGIESKDGDQSAVEGSDEDNNRSSVGNVTFNAEADDGEKGEDVDGAEDGDAEESSSADEGKDAEYEDGDDSSLSDDDSSLNVEVTYTDEDIQNLLDDFFQAEHEAIEAQEKLEDESLEAMRKEVSSELAETKSGPELEAAIEEEMETYIEICKDQLAELEDQIALLQEKLEDAGQDLPQLYKLLEKQLPELCTTETWRKRTHWVGLAPTPEAFEVVQKAELDLKEKRPVRRHHGRIQDEGASGFLVKKVESKTESDVAPEDAWSLYDVLDKEEDNPGPGSLMGTAKWASVYLASTPEQAALMGLALPGADTVEEIGDLDENKSKLFREALANEGQQSSAGPQKIIVKKVREADDVKKTKKLQRKQPPRRPRKRLIQQQKKVEGVIPAGVLSRGQNGSLPEELIPGVTEKSHQGLNSEFEVGVETEPLNESPPIITNSTGGNENEKGIPVMIVDRDGVVHFGESQASYLNNGGVLSEPSNQLKRRLTPAEIDGDPNDTKRRKTVVMIDSDDEREVEESAPRDKPLQDDVHMKENDEDLSKNSAEVVVVGSRKNSSQIVQLENMQSGVWYLSSPKGEENYSESGLLKPNTRRRQSTGKYYSDAEPRNFSCTACGMLLRNRDVMKHPTLDVGICRKCKNFLFSGPFNKDQDGHEDECRWCGQGGDVLCCESCDKVFCCPCIKRNLGEEGLDQIVNSSDWKCFFCNKQPLHNLRQQYQAVKDALKTQLLLQDSEDGLWNDKITSNKKRSNRRRNIRSVPDDRELDEKTKHLLALEKERQDLLESWRAKAKVNGKGPPVKSNRQNRHMHISDELLDMDIDDIAEEGFILNKARADNEEPVRISPHISAVLRPHQLAGMRFMWENCIESVSKVKSGVDGLGCILAHSMGLGKTLQVIGFVHTVLKKVDLGLKTVLIVVPVNVLHNWRSEFHKWQPGNEAPVPVYMLEDVARDNVNRARLLGKWQRCGGVMLIGYTAFRNLSIGKTVKDKIVRDNLCTSLQDPGPDILVCDEAHMIKNRKADITQALRQVRTHRRIALTGSPLQNNLLEYYCMVDFVREGFLGPALEFKRRFQNPIENGQRADSTSKDVKLMKHRAHVLHKQLMGFVQRKTMSVLKDELPSKCVYVISVRLSPLQRALYLKYLQINGFLNSGLNEKQGRRSILFEAYHTLAKIWNHPDLLILAQEEKNLRKEDNLENFIVDIDDDVPEVPEVPEVVDAGHSVYDGVIVINDDNGDDETAKGSVESKNKPANGIRTVSRGDGYQENVDKSGWWKDLIDGQQREVLELSGKMVILMKILSLSSVKSDKALVFSQSLHTLDLIEVFLANMPCLNGWKGNWVKNRDWYRLDGQTSAKSRQELVERFNDPDNTSVQCVLISTRAGSLGINLPAANRVIIFDGSWNPTHDLQALFRAWRFGQKKNVYAYRLLASGTMEEKIYNRQVAKEGLAARVLDEHQVGRYFVEDDLDFFFVLDQDDYPEMEDSAYTDPKQQDIQVVQSMDQPSTSTALVPAEKMASAPPPGKPRRAAFSVPDDAPPRDDIMGKLLLEYRPQWIGRYHEHEPLLEDLEDEKLSKEEQTMAWESFQHEESVPRSLASSTPSVTSMPFQPTNVASTYSFSSVQSNPLSQPHLVAQNYVPAHVGSVPCTNKTHAIQLRDEKISLGNSTVCKNCHEKIDWESIQRS